MSSYKHKVQYYETDKMGITHHSNYIRWMEEARIDYLRQIGWDYAKMESMGIISPIASVSCNYKKPTDFSEEITINVSVEEFKGVKLILHYEMFNEEGQCVCEASSVNAFIDRQGKIIRLKKEYPDLYAKLSELANN